MKKNLTLLLALCLLGGTLRAQPFNAEALIQKAQSGDQNAQIELAERHFEGWGVEHSHRLAADWYRKAADQGNPIAMLRLGEVYNTSVPLENPDSSALWIKKAFPLIKQLAESGDPAGQCWYGICFIRNYEVSPSDNEAAKWFKKSAAQGYPKAEDFLAWLYEEGRGVKRSPVESTRLYTLAAEHGDIGAMTMVAQRYCYGYGSKVSGQEGVKWYKRAAEQGVLMASGNLGYIYLNGDYGVNADPQEAAKWFRIAAEAGESNPQCTLAEMYEKGNGVKQSYEEAVKWYLKAADQDNTEAQMRLAYFYENGIYFKKSIEKAIEWYEKAARYDEEAQEALERLSDN